MSDDFPSTTRRSSAVPLLIWLACALLVAAPLTLGWVDVQHAATWLVEFRERQPLACAGLCCLGYAIITSTPLPVAVVATLFCGWLLGWGTGTIVVSFGSTLAATLTMMASRWLFRDLVAARLRRPVEIADRAMQRDGIVYLVLVRLIPGPPFFLVNVIFGLTKVSLLTYWIASQMGMFPATLLYVLAGSNLPSVADLRSGKLVSVEVWKFVVPLALVVTLPWGAHRLVASRRSSRAIPDDSVE
jgi:uncharacterized membrane protein YdjX (TVP38/TMEM64 family)